MAVYVKIGSSFDGPFETMKEAVAYMACCEDTGYGKEGALPTAPELWEQNVIDQNGEIIGCEWVIREEPHHA